MSCECPECAAEIEVEDVMVGEIVVCPDCGVIYLSTISEVNDITDTEDSNENNEEADDDKEILF